MKEFSILQVSKSRYYDNNVFSSQYDKIMSDLFYKLNSRTPTIAVIWPNSSCTLAHSTDLLIKLFRTNISYLLTFIICIITIVLIIIILLFLWTLYWTTIIIVSWMRKSSHCRRRCYNLYFISRYLLWLS